jgi:hypothetical protein
MQRDSVSSPLRNDSASQALLKSSCADCFQNCQRELTKFGIKVEPFSNFASNLNRDLNPISNQIPGSDPIVYSKIDIRPILESSLTRYYKSPSKAIWEMDIVLYYLKSIILNIDIARSWSLDKSLSSIFMSHGVYSDFNPALRSASNLGIPTTFYSGGHIPFSYYFRKAMSDLDLSTRKISDLRWREISTSPGIREMDLARDYLKNRYINGDASDLYNMPTSSNSQQTASAENYWLVLAHLNWDATADLTPMLFEDFDSWIVKTIQFASQNSAVDWKIKLHPAEIFGSNERGVKHVINSNFPVLPKNVQIIEDNLISTYDLLRNSQGVVTCYGTSGLEAATLGIPVILAGDAYYGRKGFTSDPETVSEYKDLLLSAQTIPALNSNQIELALKMSYLVWVENQLVLDWLDDSNISELEKQKQLMMYDRNSHKILKADSVLNEICELILNSEYL